MDLLPSIILGVVEGLTEFLPVSSTFHLILVSRWLGITPSDFLKMFEVVIQLGAVTSLLFLYTRTLLNNRRLSLLLLLSFIPTALVGQLLYPTIKSLFFTHTLLQLTVLVGVGLLFLLVESLITRSRLVLTRTLSSLSPRQALLLGLAQATSIIPGVSRSGSVILAALSLGFTRAQAAEYAFLLSIPTIFAASLYDLYANRLLFMSNLGPTLLPLSLGFLAAFVSALFTVQWFIKFVTHHTLRPFAYYRFVLAVLLILL